MPASLFCSHQTTKNNYTIIYGYNTMMHLWLFFYKIKATFLITQSWPSGSFHLWPRQKMSRILIYYFKSPLTSVWKWCCNIVKFSNLSDDWWKSIMSKCDKSWRYNARWQFSLNHQYFVHLQFTRTICLIMKAKIVIFSQG